MPGPCSAKELEMSPCISRKSPILSKSVGKVSLKQFRAQLVQDLAGRAVQAEDIDEFLDQLLPCPSAHKRQRRACRGPSKEVNPFSALKGADKMTEAEVVRLFGEAVSEHNLAPGMVFSRCDQRPEFNKRSTRKGKKGRNAEPPSGDTEPPKINRMRQKIDAAFFHEKDAPKDGRPHWPDQVVPVEFKSRKKGNIRDPFEGPKEGGGEEEEEEEEDGGKGNGEDEGDQAQEDDIPELQEVGDDDDEDDEDPLALGSDQFEATSYTRKAVRGQLASYIDLLFSVQQRAAIFMLFIIGRRFRILRWDRAGVIVTPSIDYVDDWKPLCEFLRRISSLPDDKLGFDPTATRLSSGDAEWSDMNDLAISLASDVDSTPRVLKAGELELEGEDAAKLVFDYQRKLFAKSISDPRWPRYKLQVHDDPTPREFLVGKPVFSAHGAIGRGTRGYIAVECATQHFVWLKDAWRAAYNLVEQEGLILERINATPGIPGVPTVVCHGDVGKQRTATAGWWERKNPPPQPEASSQRPSRSLAQKRKNTNPLPASIVEDTAPAPQLRAKRKLEDDLEHSDNPDPDADASPNFRVECPIRRHKHYRLVVGEVCMTLKNFQHGKQLAEIIFDCLTTHHLVATVDGLKVLHRDITDDNIVIFPKAETRDNVRKLVWKGLLADWEISKPIAISGARQPERSGNWQFMSVNLVNNPGPVNISDELESLILILIYYATRYLQSSIDHNADVATFLDDCFDCYTINKGLILCGERKSTIISGVGQLLYSSDAMSTISFCFSLDRFIAQALSCFRALYKVRRYDDWVSCNTPPSPTPQRPRKSSAGPGNGISNFQEEASEEARRVAQYEANWEAQPEITSTAPPPTPSAVERNIGAQMEDHTWIVWAFKKALSTDLGWDRAVRHRSGDRVPKGWKSPHAVIPVRGVLPGQNVRNTAIAQASHRALHSLHTRPGA